MTHQIDGDLDQEELGFGHNHHIRMVEWTDPLASLDWMGPKSNRSVVRGAMAVNESNIRVNLG